MQHNSRSCILLLSRRGCLSHERLLLLRRTEFHCSKRLYGSNLQQYSMSQDMYHRYVCRPKIPFHPVLQSSRPAVFVVRVLTIRNLGPEASVDVVMTPCGDYTYFCCGQDDAARTCCTLGNGTVLLAAGTAILPTATVTYTNTITGTGSLTTCLSTGTGATAALNDCQSTNHTVPIAAGLGAALGVVAITAVAFAVMWKQKSNRLKVLEETDRYTGR
jgi:hypothetical protein